jgi:CubicO group peptidase (beta-lactamase class C family)
MNLLAYRRQAFLACACISLLLLLLAPQIAQAQWTIRGEAGPEPAIAGNSGTPRAEYAQLDSIMQTFMRNANVPNAQLAVAYQGKIVYSRAYTNAYDVSTNPLGRARQLGLGLTAAGPCTPPNCLDEPSYTITTPDHIFRVASLSKLVAGLAIQQLILDGKLQADASDSAYAVLREDATALSYFSPAPFDARMLNITVRQLMEHEAGFDRDCIVFPIPGTCHPPDQPADIATFFYDPPSYVKTLDLPFAPANGTIVRSCADHLKYDLPRRKLHYVPGVPPQVNGAYYQFYTNMAYCWMSRIVEIKSGMSFEAYVKQKVLAPLGVVNAKRISIDPRVSHANEINFYYDTPVALDSSARLYTPPNGMYSAAVTAIGRPYFRSWGEWDGAGMWAFSASQYLRMLLSTKDRERPPYLLDFPSTNASGSDALYNGKSLGFAPNLSSGFVAQRYSFGAYASEYDAPTVPGFNLSHSGSGGGFRAQYSMNRRGYSYVLIANTNPEWGLSGTQRSCGTTTTTRVAAWCLVNGSNATALSLAVSTANSIPDQLLAIWNNTANRARMASAADLWVDEAPAVCSLDVNDATAGNGVRNSVADGLMILRAMNGLRGAALVNAAIGTTSNATTSCNRAEKNARDLVSTKVVDIDGDGVVQPERDGLILLRAMMGIKGTDVIAGLPAAVGTPTRTAWDGVGGMRAYINTRCSAGFL